MILIGLGSNLATFAGESRDTLCFALSLFHEHGFSVSRLSSFYESDPVGPKDQPKFINAVAEIDWSGDAQTLLSLLHSIENRLDRRRERRWHARSLDLDLLDFNGMICPDREVWRKAGQTMKPPDSLILPHPRLHERRFVLAPLLDIAPDWQHPCLHQSGCALLASIEGQPVRRLP